MQRANGGVAATCEQITSKGGGALRERVHRAVAALRRRQAPTLGGDRAALDTVRGRYLNVTSPSADSSSSSGSSYTCAGHIATQPCADLERNVCCTLMWLGASSRVALPEAKTLESLSKRYLLSGLG